VFGPFLVQAIASMLEQGKLQGDEHVSVDSQTWLPLSAVPELAPYAREDGGGGAIVPRAPGPGEIVDLPTPKRAVPEQLPGIQTPPQPEAPPAFADLPAPKRAVPEQLPGIHAPSPPQPVAPPAIADLPAPKRAVPERLPGIQPPPTDLPAPRGAAIVPPPPAPGSGPRGFDLGDFDQSPSSAPLGFADAPPPGEISDLPAPKGAAPRAPLPQIPGFEPNAGEIADLPAPKGPVPVTPTGSTGGMEYGQLDLGPADNGDLDDLPAPKHGITDLPAPKGPGPVPPPPGFSPSGGGGFGQGITDLPAPKGGITDLPAPKGGITDLPAPKGGITDLPAPKGGLTDLLAPKDGLTDLPQPKGLEYGQLDLGDSDLPTPVGGSLELDSGFDLPAPKEQGGAPNLDIQDLVEPKRGRAELEIADLVQPKPEAEADFQAPIVDAPPGYERAPQAPRISVPLADEEEVIRRPSLFKRRLLMGSLAAGVFLLVVGVALGLLTPFGFFGLKVLTGSYGDEQQGERLLQSARQEMKKDTSKDYDLAANDLEQAIRKLPREDQTPKALLVECLSSSLVRFGSVIAKRSRCSELGKQLMELEEPTPETERALALWTLARGSIVPALNKLNTLSAKEPGDAQAAVYLGWAQLAAEKPKEAKAAFSRAAAADPTSAAALFGAARAEHALGATPAALTSLAKTLKVSPGHPGALLLKTRIELAAGKRKQAEQTLKQAASPRVLALASKQERALTYIRLGDLERAKGQAETARGFYDKALKIDPQNVEGQVGLGKLYFSARKLNDALAHFQRAQAAAPKHLEAATGSAQCYIMLGRALKAQQVLQKLRPHHPKEAVIPFLLGRVEASVKNWDAAEKSFREAIRQKPTYFDPYRELSQVHAKKGDAAAALQVLADANKQLPGSPLVRDAEGMIYLISDDLATARTKFEEATRLDPAFNRAQFHLGVALMRLGELEPAKERFQIVFKRHPGYPGLAERLGELHVRSNEYKEAALSYDRALEADNPAVETRLGAARAYNLAGEYDKALKQTEKVLESAPQETAQARALRAESRLGQGKLDDALVEIRQAVNRERKAEYLVIMGEVHSARKEYADAIDAYRDALKLEPKRIDIRFRRAVLLVRGGQVKDGIRQLKKVIKAGYEPAQAQLYLGIALVESGKEKKASAAFRVAVARDPKLGEAHFRLGQILFDTRKLGAAVGSLRRALENAAETDTWRAEAQYLYGAAAQANGQKKKAIEAFLKYLRIAPPGAALKRDAMKRLLQLGYHPPKEED
jgi:tetratricopeptide (TPR) repeat protein